MKKLINAPDAVLRDANPRLIHASITGFGVRAGAKTPKSRPFVVQWTTEHRVRATALDFPVLASCLPRWCRSGRESNW